MKNKKQEPSRQLAEILVNSHITYNKLLFPDSATLMAWYPPMVQETDPFQNVSYGFGMVHWYTLIVQDTVLSNSLLQFGMVHSHSTRKGPFQTVCYIFGGQSTTVE